MKFNLLIAALAVGCFAEGNIVFDVFGNRGIGQGNDYSGAGNVWVGNRNTISGLDNGVNGNDNTVNGLQNEIVGNVNRVTGTGNTISGEGNIVQGTGNIIASDAADLPFDIESRLPAWMRTKKPETDKVSRPTTPVRPQTPSRPPSPKRSLSPIRSFTPRISERGNFNSFSPSWRRPQSAGFQRGPQIQMFSQIHNPRMSQTARRPSFREVTRSPGKTQVRQVYVTPNSRQQIVKSFSQSSNYIPGRNSNTWNWNQGSQWNQRSQWNGPNWNRGNQWNQGNDWRSNWNRGSDMFGNQLGNQWGNTWNNGAQDWANKIRFDNERAAQNLRTKIENEVRQNLDRAFSQAFFR